MNRMLIFVLENDALHVLNMNVRYEVNHKLRCAEKNVQILTREAGVFDNYF
jgi:metal-dependent HD superfamily phosphatase/phosphodiesterase